MQLSIGRRKNTRSGKRERLEKKGKKECRNQELEEIDQILFPYIN
jgi:hypothetical protein